MPTIGASGGNAERLPITPIRHTQSSAPEGTQTAESSLWECDRISIRRAPIASNESNHTNEVEILITRAVDLGERTADRRTQAVRTHNEDDKDAVTPEPSPGSAYHSN